MDELMEHEASAGQEVQARQHRGQALIVLGKSAVTNQPGETSFDDPASLPIGRFSSGIRFLLAEPC